MCARACACTTACARARARVFACACMCVLFFILCFPNIISELFLFYGKKVRPNNKLIFVVDGIFVGVHILLMFPRSYFHA